MDKATSGRADRAGGGENADDAELVKRPAYDVTSEEKGATNAFGDTVKRLRETRRLTQTALAARMEQSVSYISLIENGRRKPTQRVIASLQSALDLTPAETSELQVAAGVPTSPLDSAVNHCLAALEELVGMDVFDRHLAREDLTLILSAWKDTLQGEREMEAGRFSSAEQHFERVANTDAATPIVRGNAYFRQADVQEKQGRLKESEDSILKAQNVVRPLEGTQQARALRAEIHGTHGFMAARAGKSLAAETLTRRGRRECDALLAAASQTDGVSVRDPEGVIVAQIGIANSFSRLALQALFAGEVEAGLSYAQEGLQKIPVAPERDVIRTRLRLQGLEAWANARLLRFEEARAARQAIRLAYEAINDSYGRFKSLSYLADDYRTEAVTLLGESATTVEPPDTRRARIAAFDSQRRDAVRAALDAATTTYRESITGLQHLGESIVLASAWRSLGDVLRYRWLLDGQEEDHNACALCLNEAKLLEEQTSESQGHAGRRLVLVYESLAKLAWDEGSLASARDYYMHMRRELDTNSQATSTDSAGQQMRERITQALQLLGARGLSEPASPSPANDTERHPLLENASGETRSMTRDEDDDYTPSDGQRLAWVGVTEQLEQLIIHDLRMLIGGGLKGMSDLSDRWANALYELELQEGTRLMAQRQLSSVLFTKSLSPLPEVAREGRQRRRAHIESSIKLARENEQSICYQDICSARDVSATLRAPLGEQETHYLAQGLALLRNAGDAYHLTPIPFELPFGFAIKDRLLLLEIPRALASAELGVTLYEPGDFVCFRIEREWRLLEQMRAIFAQLLDIGRTGELSGAGAADWIRRLRATGLAAQHSL